MNGSIEDINALVVFDLFIYHDFIIFECFDVADAVKEGLSVAIIEAAYLCLVLDIPETFTFGHGQLRLIHN